MAEIEKPVLGSTEDLEAEAEFYTELSERDLKITLGTTAIAGGFAALSAEKLYSGEYAMSAVLSLGAILMGASAKSQLSDYKDHIVEKTRYIKQATARQTLDEKS